MSEEKNTAWDEPRLLGLIRDRIEESAELEYKGAGTLRSDAAPGDHLVSFKSIPTFVIAQIGFRSEASPNGMKILFGFLASIALLCGCRPSAPPYEQMSPKERLNYLRGQATHAALVESTNEVPGIRAVIETGIDDLSDSIVKWTATARLDYMNSIGGIDRTNLHLKFIVASNGRLFANEDLAYYQAQYQAHLADLERRAGMIPAQSPAASSSKPR